MYKIKLHKTSKCLWPLYIDMFDVKWMFFFWSFSKSLSKKPHRSFLCKITIDLLYFWDVYDINLWEKNFDRNTAYSCRANEMSLCNFIILRKKQWSESFLKRDSNTGVFMWNLWNFQEQWWLLLKTQSMWLHNKICSA